MRGREIQALTVKPLNNSDTFRRGREKIEKIENERGIDK